MIKNFPWAYFPGFRIWFNLRDCGPIRNISCMQTSFCIYLRCFSLAALTGAVLLLSGCEKSEKKDDTIPPGLTKKMMSQLNEKSIAALTDYISRRIDPDLNYYKRAGLYFAEEQYAKALSDVNSALAHRDNVGEYYLLRSRILRENNQLEDALHDAQRAEALLQNNAELYILLADILQEIKDDRNASQYLSLALGMDPHNANIFFVRGKLELQSGDTTSALGSFRESIRKNPRMLRAYLAGADAYMALGDYANASEIINQSIRYFPSNSDLMLQKGDIYLAQNRTDSAVYFYGKTLQLDPKRIDAHLRKINIYQNKWKSYYLAMVEYTAIKAIDPEYEEINIRIAQAYENMGNLYRAKEYYALEQEKDPESKAARYGLWKIRQKEAGLTGDEGEGNALPRIKTLDSLKINIIPLERHRAADL